MLHWLVKLVKRADPRQDNQFDKAHGLAIEFAKDVKTEYSRVRADSNLSKEVDDVTRQFYSPQFLHESYSFILDNSSSEEYKESYDLLYPIANMFIIMADHAFPKSSLVPKSLLKLSFGNSGWETFGKWSLSLDPDIKKEIVLFAYLATVLEQSKSGGASPIAYNFRVLIVALAANANPDATSREIANRIFKLIENSKPSNARSGRIAG
jgi:hypothetical protein